MLVMRALAGRRHGRGNSKLAGEWQAKRARIPCGVGACFWTARCSGSKFDDAAFARGRDLMMRTAGARIMSISGAWRAQGFQLTLMMRACGEPRWEGVYCPVHELALSAPGAALKFQD